MKTTINIFKYIFITLVSLLPFITSAQEAAVPMADTMRAEGKIYVVVLVVLTIFIGIIAWLVFLGKKITKLEIEK